MKVLWYERGGREMEGEGGMIGEEGGKRGSKVVKWVDNCWLPRGYPKAYININDK